MFLEKGNIYDHFSDSISMYIIVIYLFSVLICHINCVPELVLLAII